MKYSSEPKSFEITLKFKANKRILREKKVRYSMTFREKLQMEHPDMVDESCMGGCSDCPSTYGYEASGNYMLCAFDEGACGRCWDREIPGTEPTPKATHTKPSGIEPTPPLVSVTLTPDELDSVIDYIDCYLLQLIRTDGDIDGLEWVANIMSVWRKLKDKQRSLDATT